MADKLEKIAEELINRPYTTLLERDVLSGGEIVYLASIAEMPLCMAQGEDMDQARRELEEVMFEYVLSLLEDGEPVPEPSVTTTTAARDEPESFQDEYTAEPDPFDDLGDAVRPEHRETMSKVAWIS